jgi:predicted TIM-barrel fold metal-dependent hydrolase
MSRIGIISVDGHVKAPWAAYRDYLDPRWREPYDDWMREAAARPDFCHTGFGPDAQWTTSQRVADLEAQGVVAEILFPNGTPFAKTGASGEAVRAGNMAYNRWLADACAEVPGRMFGQALVDFDDVGLAVQEIRAAKDRGFAGILMPPLNPDSRFFFDPALDPIWAACVETGLPISQHGGVGSPSYQPAGPAAFLTLATEHSFFSGRSLWQLIIGGVFDRFPDLKVAYVETEGWWLRPVMKLLDRRDTMGDEWAEADNANNPLALKRPYSRLPSSYLATNVYIGISPFAKGLVHAGAFDDGKPSPLITTGNAMVGADYPHPETALPWLRETVQAFAALPGIGAEGARKVIYGNAAEVYGIDLAPLQPHIDRVGFELAG